MQTIPEDNQLS